jgi:CheY-like chemotaxis protein
MSGALNRISATPTRRPERRRPRLGERKPGREDRPARGGTGDAGRPASAPSETPRGRGAAGGGRKTSAGRVLIVDDEQAIRLVCRVNLRTAGFETLEASDGATALALARSERPDLILLDIMLPGLDGWSVAEELAAAEETREIPIVFLSARSDRGDVKRGYELGGVGYITKPFDATSLPGFVSRTIDAVRRGERDALRRNWLEELES